MRMTTERDYLKFIHDGEAIDNLPGVVTFDAQLGRVFRFSYDDLVKNSLEEFSRKQISQLYYLYISRRILVRSCFDTSAWIVLALAALGMFLDSLIGSPPFNESHFYFSIDALLFAAAGYWLLLEFKSIRRLIYAEVEKGVRVFSAQVKKDNQQFHMGRLTFSATERQLATLQEKQRYTVFYTCREHKILSIQPIIKEQSNLSLEEIQGD